MKKEKFFLFLIGLIIIPLILEGSLRLAGWVYYMQRAKSESAKKRDTNSIRILCLGDSFTFGSGAKPGYSYPEQLEQLLNKDNQRQKFIVYNYTGHSSCPGLNSSRLLKILDENITKYQPHIIIVLIGMHNRWNLIDSNYFLFTNHSWKLYLYRLDSLLTRLRIYKLLKITIGNLKYKFFKNNTTQKVIIEEIRENPGAEVHLRLAEQYNSYSGNHSLAIEEYKKVLDLDPDNDKAYARLGRIYENQNKYEMAAVQFKKALQINPNNLLARNRLWNVYFKQGKKELALKELEEYLRIYPQNEGLRCILRFGLPSVEIFEDDELQNKLLKYDLEGIVKTCLYRNVIPILLTYPYASPRDKIRMEVAKKYKIPFIDIASVFKRLRLSEGYREQDYFSQDGHCNENGYRIMAEEIYKVLKNGLPYRWSNRRIYSSR